jgi:hypothetical protein
MGGKPKKSMESFGSPRGFGIVDFSDASTCDDTGASLASCSPFFPFLFLLHPVRDAECAIDLFRETGSS